MKRFVQMMFVCLTSLVMLTAVPMAAQASVQPLKDSDVVGVWINHRDQSIHQRITFKSNHRWTEEQHHHKNIYHGTWKITGRNNVTLGPYGNPIRFSKNNKQMNLLDFHEILIKQNDN